MGRLGGVDERGGVWVRVDVGCGGKPAVSLPGVGVVGVVECALLESLCVE